MVAGAAPASGEPGPREQWGEPWRSSVFPVPATVAVAGGLLLAASLAGPAAAADPTVSVIATGLDNPRGIAVGANGRVFVAEARRGGADGYGRSGRIVVIGGGTTRTFTGRTVSRLAISDEGEVTGPVGVDLRADGTAVATVGIGPRAADRRFGSLLRLSPRPGRVIADIQVFRDSHPDATDIDQPAEADRLERVRRGGPRRLADARHGRRRDDLLPCRRGAA